MKIKTKHYDYSQPRAGFFIRLKINTLFILFLFSDWQPSFTGYYLSQINPQG